MSSLDSDLIFDGSSSTFEAFLNSFIPCPIPFISSGILRPPKRRTITRIIRMISVAPKFPIFSRIKCFVKISNCFAKSKIIKVNDLYLKYYPCNEYKQTYHQPAQGESCQILTISSDEISATVMITVSRNVKKQKIIACKSR